MEIELDLKLAGWKERTVFAVYVYIASAIVICVERLV